MVQYNLYNMEPLLWKKYIKIISSSYRQTQQAIIAHGSQLQDYMIGRKLCHGLPGPVSNSHFIKEPSK